MNRYTIKITEEKDGRESGKDVTLTTTIDKIEFTINSDGEVKYSDQESLPPSIQTITFEELADLVKDRVIDCEHVYKY